jgi:hypothetical protein
VRANEILQSIPHPALTEINCDTGGKTKLPFGARRPAMLREQPNESGVPPPY